ncbi:PaaI family thioesterase [uncultured Salinisphaera sp.]|uniref:PaaI family thioesterase n=1 Tax=uncultured Salinisphaera sp. TaxID=359372 RepID=UPI0032B18528|tara:strand:- start:307 stop:762 length:456 start_codon:yes stop_codon:yes gene_type:complete
MSDSNESKTTAIHEDLVAAIPYAAYLDLRIEQADEAQARIYRMPYRDELIGSPRLPALHGGTVASLLELAMQFEVLIAEAQTRIPYPVDFSIDYWRSAAAADCLCRCRLIRSGRRIAQVQAECWQDDPDRPIAFARADFLLRAVEGDNPAE